VENAVQNYDVSAVAHLIRHDGTLGVYSIRVQRAVCEPYAEDTSLRYYFNDENAQKTMTPLKCLGKFNLFEDIKIVFKDETNKPGFEEGAAIPVMCLKSSEDLPELNIIGPGLELKVVFTIRLVDSENGNLTEAVSIPTSLSLYKSLRAAVLAVASAPIRVNVGLGTITSLITYTIEGSRFLVTVSVDMTTDFLLEVDRLFTETFLLVDERFGECMACLVDCLHTIVHSLKASLSEADEALARKLTKIILRICPYINLVLRAAYPMISTALGLARPVTRLLHPLLLPLLDRAAEVHGSMQEWSIVGPVVKSVGGLAIETCTIYNAIESEKLERRKKLT